MWPSINCLVTEPLILSLSTYMYIYIHTHTYTHSVPLGVETINPWQMLIITMTIYGDLSDPTEIQQEETKKVFLIGITVPCSQPHKRLLRQASIEFNDSAE